jgi:hypothetical protein
MIGTKIDFYEIVEVIGRGGMTTGALANLTGLPDWRDSPGSYCPPSRCRLQGLQAR